MSLTFANALCLHWHNLDRVKSIEGLSNCDTIVYLSSHRIVYDNVSQSQRLISGHLFRHYRNLSPTRRQQRYLAKGGSG